MEISQEKNLKTLFAATKLPFSNLKMTEIRMFGIDKEADAFCDEKRQAFLGPLMAHALRSAIEITSRAGVIVHHYRV